MNEVDVELLRSDLAARLERWKAEDARLLEKWRMDFATRESDTLAANTFAQQALKAIILINGAGAAALLAFIGSNSALVPFALPKILIGCGVLIFGVGLSALAFALSALVMGKFATGERRDARSAEQLRIGAYACAFGAIVAFIVGSGIAAFAIGR